MSRFYFVLLLAIISSGCVMDAGNVPNDVFTVKKFNADLNHILAVQTGDALFVEGSYIEGESIRIDDPIEMMIPGAMMIPFSIRIEKGILDLASVTPSWKYYCASTGGAKAWFPGLGSVIREGDCVGIRISHDKQKYQWVVDNSNYNNGWGETIWSRSMDEDQARKHAPVPSNKPFKVQYLKRIVFDGYYGGQLHFTWDDISGTDRETRPFTFDFTGSPTEVGIKGNNFVVHKADNLKLVYEWKSLDGR